MKILTVCQGGNSRSVALGFILKYSLGIDALACSWEKNSEQTIGMLCEWADRIIVVQGVFAEKIPAAFKHKVSIYDVGPDRWFNGLHPELLEIFTSMVKQDPNFGIVQ